jgi:hypothetical protein
MRIKDVVTLKEVVSDLNDGKAFYDQRETGVGDYFWDSLIADIESLRIYAGIHNKKVWSSSNACQAISLCPLLRN